jgi:hypothetical protein
VRACAYRPPKNAKYGEKMPPTATVESIEPDAVACRASGICF